MTFSETDTGSEALVKVQRGKGSSSSKRGATSLNITIRSGSQHGVCSSPSMSSSSSMELVANDRSSATKKGSSSALVKRAVDDGCSATKRSSKSSATKEKIKHSGASSSSAAVREPLHGERLVEAASRTSASSSGSAGIVSEASGSKSGDLNLSNPWNKFQHEYAGQGFSKQTLSKLYQYQKKKDH